MLSVNIIIIFFVHFKLRSNNIICITVSYLGSELCQMSLVVRKPVFGVSDQVRHKLGCTTTQDGLIREISDLGSRGIVLAM